MTTKRSRAIFFSSNLQMLRTKENISQATLASYLGITKQAVGHWETGRNAPDLEMLALISEYFKVSVDDLLFVNDLHLQIGPANTNLDKKMDSVMDKMNDTLDKLNTFHQLLDQLDQVNSKRKPNKK